jgi:hypothetical protein
MTIYWKRKMKTQIESALHEAVGAERIHSYDDETIGALSRHTRPATLESA